MFDIFSYMFPTAKTTAMDARRNEAKKALLFAKRKYREASSPSKWDPAMERRQQEFDHMKLLLLEGQLLLQEEEKQDKYKKVEKVDMKYKKVEKEDMKYKKVEKEDMKYKKVEKEDLKEEERAAEERKEKVAMEKRRFIALGGNISFL